MIDLNPKNGRDGKIIIFSESEKYTWRDFFIEKIKSKTFRWIILFLVLIIGVNLWIFRYDDFQNNCHIKIGMSLLEWNNLQQKSALKFIRKNSSQYYKKVCTYVEKISPDLPCGGSGGGCFSRNQRKQIVVSTLGHGRSGNSDAITAAVIVHETCHSIQNEESRPFSEAECYGEMNKFLNEIGIDSPWKDYK